MDYRKARKSLFVFCIVGLIVTLLAVPRDSLLMAVTGYGIIIGGLILYYIFYRCPYCRTSWFNLRGPVPKHCPECGKEIEQENY